MMFGITPAIADTMVVESLDEITTAKPDMVVRVQVMRDCTLDSVPLKIGYILEGKMIITDPKRLKRDATFSFYPISYTDLEGNTKRFSTLYYGKFSAKFEIDAKGLAESAAASVADHFIKGISMGYYAVKGAVDNNGQNRFSSAVHNVYEHSFLSYIEKGGDLTVPKSTVFGLKFPECKNAPKKDAQNTETETATETEDLNTQPVNNVEKTEPEPEQENNK